LLAIKIPSQKGIAALPLLSLPRKIKWIANSQKTFLNSTIHMQSGIFIFPFLILFILLKKEKKRTGGGQGSGGLRSGAVLLL